KGSEAAKIASFYGFLSIQSPRITKADLEVTNEFDEEWNPAEKAALLREINQLKAGSYSQPLMLFYEKNRSNRIECTLTIFGSNKSVCEALLIQATRAILENVGLKEISVRINSIGNKENLAEFERKAQAFTKKKIADFTPELQQYIKKDPFYIIKSKDQKYKEWREMAPQSVDYLSEDSRAHLKEILEFMETMGLFFTMDSSLLGDLQYATETIFEIAADSKEEVVAKGFRWNRLSRKIDNKKEVPAVSIQIKAKTTKTLKNVTLKKLAPKFYLVQFGSEAKQKSFLVLEKLRKAGVAVSHSLTKDKLTGQIFSAEQGGLPYIILLGQKEAVDNVVVIRNTTTRAQYTVPIENLGEFIKKSHDFK
ncbi:MAG: His/Gly/Thr/Pro-type tRNA ligase C-terminal domain-containing protein, partial [Patescibacteria group bacterium]